MPTILPRMRHAGRRARGVAQDLEDRERPAEQRIEAAARLDHHELSRLGAGGHVGRVEREDVVIGREPGVGADHGLAIDRGDAGPGGVEQHRLKVYARLGWRPRSTRGRGPPSARAACYSPRWARRRRLTRAASVGPHDALRANADERAAGRTARRGLRHDPGPPAQSPDPVVVVDGGAALRPDGPVLRAAPDRPALRHADRPRGAGAAAALAGLAQHPHPLVGRPAGGRRGRGVDVGQLRRLRAGARRRLAAPARRGGGRDDAVRGAAPRHRDRALLVRAPRQPGRRDAADADAAGVDRLSADGARLGRSAAARGARDRSVAAGRGRSSTAAT